MAVDLMNLSESQTIRIKKSYQKFGTIGLISKRSGNPSPNKLAEEIKEALIKISVETLRKPMIKEGIWKSKKHKKVIAPK